MRRIWYTPGSGGDAVALDGPVRAPSGGVAGLASGAALDLHSYGWEYELGARGVTSAVSQAREADLSCGGSHAAAEAALEAFARDMEALSPGTLTVGAWSQRCLVPEAKASATYLNGVVLDLTVLLLDGWWWRERSLYLRRLTNTGGTDFPLDHPHDLGFNAGRMVVANASAVAAPLMLTFWGPCVSPYVTVAGNRHEFDVEVPTGSVLVADGRQAAKTVTLYDAQGNGSNAFSGAVREEGAQAFAPLPAGASEVVWSGAFSFRLDWRELRAVAPWGR